MRAGWLRLQQPAVSAPAFSPQSFGLSGPPYYKAPGASVPALEGLGFSGAGALGSRVSLFRFWTQMNISIVLGFKEGEQTGSSWGLSMEMAVFATQRSSPRLLSGSATNKPLSK